MNKVLIVGGTSLIGKALLKNKAYKFVAPSRSALDLRVPKSIADFDYKGFGCLILVAGAGMRHGRKFGFKESIVDFDYISNTIDVNCKGSTLLMKKYLARNPKGKVVLIGSISVTETATNNVVYASSKMYLDRLVDLLANVYPKTDFIKINPAGVQHRFQKKPSGISPKDIADITFKAMEKKIKRIDIVE